MSILENAFALLLVGCVAFRIGQGYGEIVARDRLERAIAARKPTIQYNEETDEIWVETARGREDF